MKSCRFQQNTEMKRNSFLSDLMVCPKPLDLSTNHQLELCESNSGNEVLDLILAKDGGCEESPAKTVTSSFFSGSPPSRVSNPLTRDSLFQALLLAPPPPSIPRATKPQLPSSPRNGGGGGGCVRVNNFVNNPPVRVVGFDCPNRDRRSGNRSISTLA